MLWTFLKVFLLTLAWLIWRHMDQHCNGAAADGSFFKCALVTQLVDRSCFSRWKSVKSRSPSPPTPPWSQAMWHCPPGCNLWDSVTLNNALSAFWVAHLILIVCNNSKVLAILLMSLAASDFGRMTNLNAQCAWSLYAFCHAAWAIDPIVTDVIFIFFFNQPHQILLLTIYYPVNHFRFMKMCCKFTFCQNFFAHIKTTKRIWWCGRYKIGRIGFQG